MDTDEKKNTTYKEAEDKYNDVKREYDDIHNKLNIAQDEYERARIAKRREEHKFYWELVFYDNFQRCLEYTYFSYEEAEKAGLNCGQRRNKFIIKQNYVSSISDKQLLHIGNENRLPILSL